jgi:predicted nucleotidyltransferase
MGTVTVSDRKRRAAERLANAAEAVMRDLSEFARSRSGGRFVVFGSAATGQMHYGSDFDVLIDFPPEQERAAWDAVEDSCARHGIKPDILPASMTKASFIERLLESPIRTIP